MDGYAADGKCLALTGVVIPKDTIVAFKLDNAEAEDAGTHVLVRTKERCVHMAAPLMPAHVAGGEAQTFPLAMRLESAHRAADGGRLGRRCWWCEKPRDAGDPQ